MVLVDAGKELGVKKIVELAVERGWWKSYVTTPHATIYAAVSEPEVLQDLFICPVASAGI